jgi:hypothetical protein
MSNIGGIALIVMLLYLIFAVLRLRPDKQSNKRPLNESREREAITNRLTDTLRGDGTYSLNVVGESFYQDALDRICGGKDEDGHNKETSARLVPEPHNPHDKNAVAVCISGEVIGYLDKQRAKRYGDILHGSVIEKCPALITGGWKRKGRGKNSEGHYGVKLDLNL